MKRIGLIGGTGPEATLDYYAGITSGARNRLGHLQYPEIIVYSVNIGQLVELFEAADTDGVANLLLEKLEALHGAGADFAAIAAVTPHMVFGELAARSPLPMLSIVEATCERAKGVRLERIGLMGTGFTMASDFSQEPFLREGMTVVLPRQDERELIHAKIVGELESRIIREETRQAFLGIASRMMREDGIDSLVLGCTEIPIILDRDYLEIPFLNAAAIHVEAILDHCLAK
ncbi:amino acid racemase [Candidatus Fermentibacterales bacterium]|nr:amino acid racemase [Candidatus Fermentibacterales bacterium]